MRVALWLVFAVFWAGGEITGGAAPGALWAAPVFLLLAGMLAFRWELIPGVLIGFAAEIAGTHTGFPFGSYMYTDALGPKIAGVPLAIAAAWLVVSSLATSCRWPWSMLVFVAADLVIDPLAAGPLHYWIWRYPGHYYGIPLTNYAGWVLVAAIICGVSQSRSNAKPAAGLFVMLFFAVLAVRYRLWIPAVCGFLVILSVAVLWYRPLETSCQTIPASE